MKKSIIRTLVVIMALAIVFSIAIPTQAAKKKKKKTPKPPVYTTATWKDIKKKVEKEKKKAYGKKTKVKFVSEGKVTSKALKSAKRSKTILVEKVTIEIEDFKTGEAFSPKTCWRYDDPRLKGIKKKTRLLLLCSYDSYDVNSCGIAYYMIKK